MDLLEWCVTTLVIVESPAKARKIASLLGSGYAVEASVGHVRDLPGRREEIPESHRHERWASLGVHPETFRALYVVPPGKAAVVERLRASAARASQVLFAADPDREGEAIAWHLSVLLGIRDPVRMVYTEITRDALHAALATTRPIDYALVGAQEARRVIDRLVGYGVSPLLWRGVARGLSAGRVQSAVLSLLAERELARMAFRGSGFWSIRADVAARPRFTVHVSHVRSSGHPEPRALARPGDFTPQGALRDGADVVVMSEPQAHALAAYLDGRDATVTSCDTVRVSSRPAPPFTTSTLQQAGGRVGLGAREVMEVAQRLYEAGFITYMRTDSPHLSDEALTEARRVATALHGAAAVPPAPRQYATRAKNAQEAHEAIRPSGTSWRDPAVTGLVGDQLALYTLVYRRAVASQMVDAEYDRTTVVLTAGAATLRAQGRVQVVAGHTALLAPDDDDDGSVRLPSLVPGQVLSLVGRPAEGKKTAPPARFTEATLVREMERAGIGRPSTYAQTLSTLVSRGYVQAHGRGLAVSALGLVVARYLHEHVPEIARPDFTATMEAGLDDVAAGQRTRVDYLTEFWTRGLAPLIRRAGDDMPGVALPQFDGVFLRPGPSGMRIVSDGVVADLPEGALPAELDDAALAQVMAGTWRPARRRRAGRAKAGAA